MAERFWRSLDDHSAAGPPDPPLRHRRDRQRQMALQEPRLTPAPSLPPGLAPMGPQAPPRAAASASQRALRGARVPPMDYRHKPTLRGVNIGRRSRVNIQRRLTNKSPYGRFGITLSEDGGRFHVATFAPAGRPDTHFCGTNRGCLAMRWGCEGNHSVAPPTPVDCGQSTRWISPCRRIKSAVIR